MRPGVFRAPIENLRVVVYIPSLGICGVLTDIEMSLKLKARRNARFGRRLNPLKSRCLLVR